MRSQFLFLVISLPLLLAGCDNSTPTNVENIPSPQTPDEAVEWFRLALAERDSLEIQDVLSEDFRLHAGRNPHILGVEYLDRERFVMALTRMCGPVPELEPCNLDSVDISFWSNRDWEFNPHDPRFPDLLSKRYNVTMRYHFPSCDTYIVHGDLFFYVKEDSVGAMGSIVPRYELAGISDYTWDNNKAVESDAFSQVIDTFLFEGLPHSLLSEEEIRGTDQVTYILDASASWCGGEGLHDQPFRWNVDGSDQWSEWGEAVHGGFQFDEPGEHSVVLEVRNKVGWTAQATTEFEIYAVYPATVDQLLATFSYAHEERDLLALISCLEPGFSFNIQSQDVIDYGLPGDQFSMSEFFSATSNLFDPLPGPGRPGPALEIYFWINSTSAAPVDTVDLNFNIHRNPDESLFIGGLFSFVANQAPIDFPGGGTIDVWRFGEITDRTITTGYMSGNITWGGMLATYR